MIDACTVLRHTCRTIVLRVVTALVDNRFFHMTIKFLPSLMFTCKSQPERANESSLETVCLSSVASKPCRLSNSPLAPPRARLQSPQAT